jgi:hypothetical protein
MRKHRVWLAVWIVTALLTACAGEVGTTQTEIVNVPRPADRSQAWDVELNLGAASAQIGSSGEALVQGTIEYNVAALKPIVTIGERRVRIAQEFSGVLPLNSRNEWRLQLGSGAPMNLIVNTGASSGEWELGGLSLRRLEWTQGAAGATLSFSFPNLERLDYFRINAGAGTVTVRGLANANARTANFTAGAGAMTLVFDGQLVQDADVTLDGGVSAIAIYSGGNPIRLTSEGPLKSVENSGWLKESEDTYLSPEWSTAPGPTIRIRARLGVAALRLIAGK